MSSLPADAAPRAGSSFVALPARERGHVIDLPQPLTTFIGRTDEIAALVDRLRQPSVRLLTLTGPGGTGKTRLSLAVANQIQDDFERIHWVSLTSTNDPTLVPVAVARVVGVREAVGVAYAAALQDQIRDQPVLLLLDNMEQVTAAGTFIAALLSRCPNLKILVTSRVTLRVSGEHEFVVPTLSLPESHRAVLTDAAGPSEAVALFIERVRAFQPDFSPIEDEAEAVAEICRQLDGLPLAIELAAARIRTYSPPALLRRLSNRLDLLTGGPRDLPPHQQTMRDTIAWSHALLAPDEQALFRRLSIFRGGFSVSTAAAVCAMSEDEALDALGSLVSQSLLRAQSDEQGEPRFWMLVTIRDYGAEQLAESGEAAAYRQRHAEVMLALVKRAVGEINGPEEEFWLDLLDRESANIETALAWLLAGDQVVAYGELVTAIEQFWNIRGRYGDGGRWIEAALRIVESESMPDSLRAGLLHAAGRMVVGRGPRDLAERYGEESLIAARRSGDRMGIVRALQLLATISYRSTDYERARRLLDDALDICDEIGATYERGINCYRRALVEMDDGQLDRALDCFAEAKTLFELQGNRRELAATLDNMGVALYCQNRIDEAEALSIGALETLRRFGDKRGVAVALGHVGKCASRRGDFARSWAIHQEALQYRTDLSEVRGLSVWLEAVAYLLAAAIRPEAAICAMGATDAARETTNHPLFGNELIEHKRVVGEVRASLGDEAFSAAWLAGRATPLDLAINNAIAAAESIFTEPAKTLQHPAARYGLTPRELEVADLIALRYSDKEIADTLYISPRTVARHVANIYDKLDVRTRREAAAVLEQASSPEILP